MCIEYFATFDVDVVEGKHMLVVPDDQAFVWRGGELAPGRLGTGTDGPWEGPRRLIFEIVNFLVCVIQEPLKTLQLLQSFTEYLVSI